MTLIIDCWWSAAIIVNEHICQSYSDSHVWLFQNLSTTWNTLRQSQCSFTEKLFQKSPIRLQWPWLYNNTSGDAAQYHSTLSAMFFKCDHHDYKYDAIISSLTFHFIDSLQHTHILIEIFVSMALLTVFDYSTSHWSSHLMSASWRHSTMPMSPKPINIAFSNRGWGRVWSSLREIGGHNWEKSRRRHSIFKY